MFKKAKAFTTAEYAKTSSIAKRTAVKEIAKLAKAGLVLKEGKGKNTLYHFK